MSPRNYSQVLWGLYRRHWLYQAQTPLEQYGIDSIVAVNLTTQLEKTFGPLSKTLFFEYLSIAELAQYFIDEHHAKLQNLLADHQSAQASQTAAAQQTNASLTTTTTASLSDLPFYLIEFLL